MTLRSVALVSNLSGILSAEPVEETSIFSKYVQLLSVLITLFQFYSIRVFSGVAFPTWSMTHNPRVILASWDQPKGFRVLRFLFLKQ